MPAAATCVHRRCFLYHGGSHVSSSFSVTACMYHCHAGSTDKKRANCGLICLQTTVFTHFFEAVLLVLVIIGDGPSLGHTRSAAPQPTCAPASKSLSSMIGGGVHKSTTPSSRPCLQIADGTAPPSFRAADMWVESWGSVSHAF